MTALSAADLLVAAVILVLGLALAHAVAWRLSHFLIEAALPALAKSGARNWLSTPLAWTRRHAPRLYAGFTARVSPRPFTGLPLTVFALAALWTAAMLAGIGDEVVDAQDALPFDQAINTYFGPWRQGPLIAVFIWITALGAGPALTAVLIVVTAIFLAFQKSGFVVPLWVTFLGAQATTWISKYVIARHRPDFIQAVREASPSFPSGHATAVMALYGFLAYALARDLPCRRQRFEVIWWTAMVILLIDFSRLFLSLHFATDVVAGNMVGGFWLLVGCSLAEWRRMRSEIYARSGIPPIAGPLR